MTWTYFYHTVRLIVTDLLARASFHRYFCSGTGLFSVPFSIAWQTLSRHQISIRSMVSTLHVPCPQSAKEKSLRPTPFESEKERETNHMRQQHNMRIPHQPRMNFRFLLENIQSTRSHLPALQSFHQSILINDSSASGIDDDDPFLHFRELLRADDMVRVLVQGEIQTDDVGSGEELVERDVSCSAG